MNHTSKGRYVQKYGLPTFPISPGMSIGQRTKEEIDWLLEHGRIVPHTFSYVELIKREHVYSIIKWDDEEETPVIQGDFLQVISVLRPDISQCIWFEKVGA